MKKFILYLVLFAGSFSGVRAQTQPEDPKAEEKIQTLYIAYVSKKLVLTEDEAKKFWPIHTEFETEMKAVVNTEDVLVRDEKVLNIKKKYQDKFTKVVGATRTNTFYGLADEFRKKMIERLRKIREQKNLNQRRPGRP